MRTSSGVRHAQAVAVMLLGLVTSAAADFDAAMAHYRGKRFAAAAVEFKALTEADPSYDYGHFMFGVCSYRTGNNEVAIASLHRAIELEAGKFAYHNALATAELKSGDAAAAFATLNGAAAIADSDREKLELYRNRATAARRLGEFRVALDDLAQVTALRTKLELPSSSRFGADISFERGVCQLNLGQFSAAIAEFDGALKAQPDRKDAHAYLTAAWRRLGAAEMRLGRYRGAARAFRKVLELDPGSCRARINLGKCHLGVGDWAQVIETLARARKCAPTDAGVLEGLGLARLKRGELLHARRLYREASRLAPHSARIREGLDLVAARIARRDGEAEESAADKRAEAEYLKRLAAYDELEKKREKWEQPAGDAP